MTTTTLQQPTFGITSDKPFITSDNNLILELSDKVYEYNNKRKNEYKAELSQSILVKLLGLLDCDRIWITQTGSKLDCHLKIDCIVKYNNQYIGFQVKSSQYMFDEYVRKWCGRRLSAHDYLSNNETTYIAPGAVWLNGESDRIKLLVSLSEWLNIPIRQHTKDALIKLKQCKKLRVRTIGSDVAQLIKLSVDDVNVWVNLGLASMKNGVINYVR